MENVAVVVQGLNRSARRAVIARAVDLQGFGSRRVGEVVVLTTDGVAGGELLGGGADERLTREAAELLAGPASARLVDVHIADGPAVAAGLACAGSARILLQDAGLVPGRWWELVAAREPAALVSPLGESAGQIVTTATETGEAVTGEAVTGEAVTGEAEAGEAVTDRDGPARRAGELLARQAAATEIVDESVVEVWWPATHVLVVGAAALTGAIARQAGLLGWSTTIDPAQAGTDLTPDDARDAGVEGAAPTGLRAAMGALGPADAVVVLTHDPAIATPVLEVALRGRVGFVGALGSRSTQANRRARLTSAGVPPEAIARLHGPVGLDLGARNPEEQALAICAEILAVLRGRSAGALTVSTGPING
jgi:xanthine dehydrogenase accessory factor